MTINEIADQLKQLIGALEAHAIAADSPDRRLMLTLWSKHLREDYKSIRLLARPEQELRSARAARQVSSLKEHLA